MALLPATLAAALIANVDNFETEAQAAAAWADSFDTYFQSAMAGPVPVVPFSTTLAKGDMESSLTGMSVAGAGAAALLTGITAYWANLSTNAATVFLTSTSVTPPPTLGTLTATLEANFLANTNGNVDKVTALTLIANSIHIAQTGGIAVFPPTPGGIGPQTIL